MEPKKRIETLREEIEKMQAKIEALEVEEAAEELNAKKRAFMKDKAGILSMRVGQMNPVDIASQCHMLKINDLLVNISECLGYEVTVPQELGTKSVSYVLCAVDMLLNDERFKMA